VSHNAAAALIITCEHGGNRIPRPYAHLFRGARAVLESHRGYDPGTLELAKLFAARLMAPLFASTTSRLLVELNRSLHHRALFSEFTTGLDPAARRQLVESYYLPHRQAVEDCIAESVRTGRGVMHLSVHSFTPVLNGVTRHGDIGLLYDPLRSGEREFCLAWQRGLQELRPDVRVRRNYPYLGKSDGFTTFLRKRFPDASYAGIELEVNQRWPQGPKSDWRRLQSDLIGSFAEALGDAAGARVPLGRG
jgi:predicted N-formylglutamate amidohydrolase